MKYKEGTTKDQIIYDGWSRGFKVDQTVQEVREQGFDTTEDEVLLEWCLLEELMRRDMDD